MNKKIISLNKNVSIVERLALIIEPKDELIILDIISNQTFIAVYFSQLQYLINKIQGYSTVPTKIKVPSFEFHQRGRKNNFKILVTKSAYFNRNKIIFYSVNIDQYNSTCFCGVLTKNIIAYSKARYNLALIMSFIN